MNNYQTVEIDIGSYTKEELLLLIELMHHHDMTFNQFIVYLLTKFINEKNGV